jgi:hypothetical protein
LGVAPALAAGALSVRRTEVTIWQRETRMTEDTKPPAVTRGELYSILGSVYLLIAYALLGMVRLSEQRTMILIGQSLLFVAALALSVTYSNLGIRERRRGTRARSNPAEPAAAANGGRDSGSS